MNYREETSNHPQHEALSQSLLAPGLETGETIGIMFTREHAPNNGLGPGGRHHSRTWVSAKRGEDIAE